MIPYSKQFIDQKDIKMVVNSLRGKFITQGPKVEEFEKKICKIVKCKYAVAVSSCSAGLHIASIASGLKRGSTMLTTPNTFCSTANSALHCGAKVEFSDININTGNICLDNILKIINKKKIKVIIPVHFGGLPVEVKKLRKISRKKKILIIEDAAHALGAKYSDGSMVGSCKFSDMAVFSFHPVKSITTGEGGVITTNNKDLYEKLKNLRSHGIEKNQKKLKNNGNKIWYYEMRDLGFHYRITDIQCALGISQLNKLKKFVSYRRKIANNYDKLFSKIPGIKVLQNMQRNRSSNHLYVIKINFKRLGIKREIVMKKLRKKGIITQVHYIPVTFHPFYKKKSYKKKLQNMTRYYDECLSIPIFYKLKLKDQRYIVNSIKNIIER